MLKQGLKKLLNSIEEQLNNEKVNLEILEEACAPIIADDHFDSLPTEVQDQIYLIDMHEIENMNTNLLSSAYQVIKEHYSTLK